MLVIGNGESRSLVDLEKIKDKKIGCNAILRDTKVDHLVCVDKRMLKEAMNSSYHKDTKVYTRKDWWVLHRLEKNIRMVPELPYAGSDRWDMPWHWGAGPYAVLLGCKVSADVRLVGFDLYSKDGKVNNIYKDTENYAMAHKRAVDPAYWIVQIGKLFDLYSYQKFTIYQDDWQLPKAWNKPNVKVDRISNIYYNT